MQSIWRCENLEQQNSASPGLEPAVVNLDSVCKLLMFSVRLKPFSALISNRLLLLQPCNIRVEFELQWWSRSRRGSAGKQSLVEMDSA